MLTITSFGNTRIYRTRLAVIAGHIGIGARSGRGIANVIGAKIAIIACADGFTGSRFLIARVGRTRVVVIAGFVRTDACPGQ